MYTHTHTHTEKVLTWVSGLHRSQSHIHSRISCQLLVKLTVICCFIEENFCRTVIPSFVPSFATVQHLIAFGTGWLN